jgi:hypothetical protein
MDYRPLLIGFASVVLGWTLSELSQVLRASSARRRALNKALAELIELRHYQQAVDVVFAEVGKRWPISRADLSAGLQWMEKILPPDPGLSARFEVTVTEIASVDPMLAFTLRSKDQGPFLLAQLRAAQLPVNDDTEFLAAMESFIRTSFVAALERTITEVAWEISFLCWVRARRFLRRKVDLPKDAAQIFALGEKAAARNAGGA